MKTLLFGSMILAVLVAGCNAFQTKKENGNNGNTSDSTGAATDAKKISKRDYSITKENSYSDLFLDSAALENSMVQKKVPDSVAWRMRSFYNTRNYQYAWFSTDGLTEQARAFWNLLDYHVDYNKDTALRDKDLEKRMDKLTAIDTLSIGPSDKSYLSTELTMTERFIQYVMSAYEDGYVKRKEMERFIPLKQQDPLQMADSLLNKKHKDNKYYEDINPAYKSLKDELGRYYNIAKNGGWPVVDSSLKKSLKKGITDARIPLIKRRLQLSGDMPGNDSTQVFDDTLELAVKNFQQRYGYTPTGTINKTLIHDMDVPATERVEQILINMDRMRWMPQRPAGNLILVNIPEFVLHVLNGKNKVFDMNVVVGKEGHNTVIFTGDLNEIVFSPYWNVPQSIVEKEILPAMEKNPNYLEEQHMEQTGTEDGLPKIRQLPGPWNSLGRVKFLFPNSFNIYFHDTNAKELFNRDKRAYSHGCIRLAEPEKMAEFLLQNQPEWTPDKIEEAMNSTDEKHVRLKNPVPVFISYYTAWVDDNGQMNFRDDIYGHDKDLQQKMFTRNTQPLAIRSGR